MLGYAPDSTNYYMWMRKNYSLTGMHFMPVRNNIVYSNEQQLGEEIPLQAWQQELLVEGSEFIVR